MTTEDPKTEIEVPKSGAPEPKPDVLMAPVQYSDTLAS